MRLLYAQKAGIEHDLCEKVCRYYEKHDAKINKTAEKFYLGNDLCLNNKSDLFRLACVLKAFEYTYKDYVKNRISDDVFFDTISDIGIWCEENANQGLSNFRWLKNHVRFELFRLGRLQFQLFPSKNILFDYSKLPFSRGDNLIYIHIPKAANLDIEECKKSIDYARRFFAEYFSEFEYDYFICESWLLFKGNSKFMKKSANIIKFAELFEYGYSIYNEAQAFERIFGISVPIRSKRKIAALPQNTSLQKSAVEFKLSGGKFGEGICWIKK